MLRLLTKNEIQLSQIKQKKKKKNSEKRKYGCYSSEKAAIVRSCVEFFAKQTWSGTQMNEFQDTPLFLTIYFESSNF